MKQPDNSSKFSNMKGAHNKNVKGKQRYMPGIPKAKAHQHPIDESGPVIKISKTAKYKK